MKIFSFGISEMSQALLPQRGHLSGFDFLSIYAPFFITVSFTANTKGKKYIAVHRHIFLERHFCVFFNDFKPLQTIEGGFLRNIKCIADLLHRRDNPSLCTVIRSSCKKNFYCTPGH